MLAAQDSHRSFMTIIIIFVMTVNIYNFLNNIHRHLLYLQNTYSKTAIIKINFMKAGYFVYVT